MKTVKMMTPDAFLTCIEFDPCGWYQVWGNGCVVVTGNRLPRKQKKAIRKQNKWIEYV